MVTKEEKIKMGKKSRKDGAAFELHVKKDLESRDWIVDKWSNNIEFETATQAVTRQLLAIGTGLGAKPMGKIISAKRKYNPFNKALSIGTGFPDFVAFKKVCCNECVTPCGYNVIGVESKSNGYLDKSEKEKVEWLLDHNVFDFILIASKGNERGEILYEQRLKGGKKQQWK